MNIFLWVLQIGLAAHTLIGAIWKFSHSAEQTMPTIKAIPQGIWLSMSGLEIVASICLVLPLVYKPLGFLVPVAAAFVILEMLLFAGLHLGSGATAMGPLVYWLVVALICAFIIYGRLMLKPFGA